MTVEAKLLVNKLTTLDFGETGLLRTSRKGSKESLNACMGEWSREFWRLEIYGFKLMGAKPIDQINSYLVCIIMSNLRVRLADYSSNAG